MPSIELLSLGCAEEVVLDDYGSFSWCAELGRPVGHRGSFDGYLKTLNGFFVHLGNTDLVPERDWYWTAYKLIDLKAVDEQRSRGKHPLQIPFRSAVKRDVARLAQQLIFSSPLKTLIFLTDYQLAEEEGDLYPAKRLKQSVFMDKLTDDTLTFNTLYEVVGD